MHYVLYWVTPTDSSNLPISTEINLDVQVTTSKISNNSTLRETLRRIQSKIELISNDVIRMTYRVDMVLFCCAIYSSTCVLYSQSILSEPGFSLYRYHFKRVTSLFARWQPSYGFNIIVSTEV